MNSVSDRDDSNDKKQDAMRKMISQAPTVVLVNSNLQSIKEIPSQEPSTISEAKPNIEKNEAKNLHIPISTSHLNDPAIENLFLKSKSADSFSPANSKANSALPALNKIISGTSEFQDTDGNYTPSKSPGTLFY
jgi:hypothetical protein